MAMTGQELIKRTQEKLGGYANAQSPQILLGYLNEAQEEVWGILKSLNEQQFISYSQSTDANAPSYFPALASNQREYPLPDNFREMKFIEVANAQWPTVPRFVFRAITHPDFINSRRASTADPSVSTASLSTDYVYTITGSNPKVFVLASWPEQPFVLRLWYVHTINPILIDRAVEEIVWPFDRKLTDYAAKRVMLAADPAAFALWKQEWKDAIVSIATSSGQNGSDAVFVSDFEG